MCCWFNVRISKANEEMATQSGRHNVIYSSMMMVKVKEICSNMGRGQRVTWLRLSSYRSAFFFCIECCDPLPSYPSVDCEMIEPVSANEPAENGCVSVVAREEQVKNEPLELGKLPRHANKGGSPDFCLDNGNNIEFIWILALPHSLLTTSTPIGKSTFQVLPQKGGWPGFFNIFCQLQFNVPLFPGGNNDYVACMLEM